MSDMKNFSEAAGRLTEVQRLALMSADNRGLVRNGDEWVATEHTPRTVRHLTSTVLSLFELDYLAGDASALSDCTKLHLTPVGMEIRTADKRLRGVR